MHGGTIIDATVIASTPSDKNQGKNYDKIKTGNKWHHGIKTNVGVDAGTSYIHLLTGTATNVQGIDQAYYLIREDDP